MSTMMPDQDPVSASRDVSQCLRWALGVLHGEDARREAERLLEDVLQQSRTWLFLHSDHPLEPAQLARFRGLVERRAAGEPLAYLLGRQGFWTLDLKVTPATLIPRPETELLVEVALECIPPDSRWQLLDLGTGSGAIALALASERPQARVLATDASAAALQVAAENARLHQLERVEFLQGSWYRPLAGRRFDLIASNPPYVAPQDPHLQQGDLRFEPQSALSSAQQGLADLREIIEQAPGHLLPGGWIVLEHGLDQGAAVRALLQASGFAGVETRRDLECRERVSLARWPV